VLTGVTPESTVYREEMFGPVLAALTFTGEDEAIKLANDPPYGLAGTARPGERRARDRRIP
jgi:acyl-CoA reductase-like NAD-dependent aldehyde dehydrogenase